jgi:hypothetical protein
LGAITGVMHGPVFALLVVLATPSWLRAWYLPEVTLRLTARRGNAVWATVSEDGRFTPLGVTVQLWLTFGLGSGR